MTARPVLDMWRIDITGQPINVEGKHAYDLLQKWNIERNRMKLALHRIAKLDADDFEHGRLDHAKSIAREALA